MQVPAFAWSIALFAARETPAVLAASVRAAMAACAGRTATVDVLINGNAELADAFAKLAADWSQDGCTLRVWSIAAPDKAHTWNEYVHRIWDTGGIAFFIDGYAQVRRDALAAMERRLAATPSALGATGVPSCGRSAARLREQMLREGGIHGNLYAVSPEGMLAIRAAGFRLPLGLYRTDPLLSSVLKFRLDPATHTWEHGRVAVEPDATWDVAGISRLTIGNLSGQFKRMLRQAQGDLENRAAREHLAVKRLAPQLLPATARDLITGWLDAQPAQARALFMKRPLCLYAARKARKARDWSSTRVAPALVLTRAAASA